LAVYCYCLDALRCLALYICGQQCIEGGVERTERTEWVNRLKEMTQKTRGSTPFIPPNASNLPMFQQLLKLIIPNKPRASKVQIPEPNKLTTMFTHRYRPSQPTSRRIDYRQPPLGLLLYLPSKEGRTIASEDIIPYCP
jgi:hypothetical protein